MGLIAKVEEHGLFAGGAADEDEDNEQLNAVPPIQVQLSHRTARPLPIRSLGVCSFDTLEATTWRETISSL